MYENGMTDHLEGITAVMEATENPHHRAILDDYRRHVALENSGQAATIINEMMVDKPYYKFVMNEGTFECTSREEVAGLYTGMVDVAVVLADERLALADWGFTSVSNMVRFGTGAWFAEKGFATLEEPEANYAETTPWLMLWDYTPEAVLVGERVWRLGDPSYEKVSSCPSQADIKQQCLDFLAKLEPRKS